MNLHADEGSRKFDTLYDSSKTLVHQLENGWRATLPNMGESNEERNQQCPTGQLDIDTMVQPKLPVERPQPCDEKETFDLLAWRCQGWLRIECET